MTEGWERWEEWVAELCVSRAKGGQSIEGCEGLNSTHDVRMKRGAEGKVGSGGRLAHEVSTARKLSVKSLQHELQHPDQPLASSAKHLEENAP